MSWLRNEPPRLDDLEKEHEFEVQKADEWYDLNKESIIAARCPAPGRDCSDCPMFEDGLCLQDDDLGDTGHGDISYSDADPGL